MPPEKHKKGNQNVRGDPAKRIRTPSRRVIEATLSVMSEISDTPCAPASNNGGKTLNVSQLPLAQQFIAQPSSDRQIKAPVDSLALRVSYQRTKVCSTAWALQPQVQSLNLARNLLCSGESVYWGSHYWAGKQVRFVGPPLRLALVTP